MRRMTVRGWITLGVCTLLAGSLWAEGALIRRPAGAPRVFWNFSASMPLGLYRVVGGRVSSGDLVIFPGKSVPSYGLRVTKYLLKRVISCSRERVTIDGSGLSIGGKLIAKRVKPFGIRFDGVVPPGEALVLGENPRSFDSRYYGPVPLDEMTRVKAIVTW